MVLVMNDRRHLEAVRSPLARFAAQRAADNGGGEGVRFFYQVILGTDCPDC
jgi:hypothetical protein